jgi:hypothetical protein
MRAQAYTGDGVNGSSTFYSSEAQLFEQSINGAYTSSECDCGSRSISWLELDLPISTDEAASFLSTVSGEANWDDGGRCDYLQLG